MTQAHIALTVDTALAVDIVCTVTRQLGLIEEKHLAGIAAAAVAVGELLHARQIPKPQTERAQAPRGALKASPPSSPPLAWPKLDDALQTREPFSGLPAPAAINFTPVDVSISSIGKAFLALPPRPPKKRAPRGRTAP